ncbi:MAG: hypothetical protein AAF732_23020 [Pseudomonadota bacterium]
MARWSTGFDISADCGGASASGAIATEVLFERGLNCSAGRGVALDLVAAHMWFNLAAARGHESAKAYRSEIAEGLSRQEISQAQRQARDWLQNNPA